MWIPWRIVISSLASGGTSSGNMLTIFFTDTGREIPVGTTITRIRGEMNVFAQSDGVIQGHTVGMFLAPEGGVGTDPTLDAEITEMIWMHMGHTDGSVSESAAGVFRSNARIIQIDTKAKRKITKIGEELTFLYQNEVGSIVDVEAGGWILLQMP